MVSELASAGRARRLMPAWNTAIADSRLPRYDGHGSERTVTASNQSVTGTINFEAFGQTVGSTGSSSSPYMYAGA